MVFDDKMHDIIGVLENDGVILYPTDTIWGLGCNVFSEKGLNRIYNIKGRKPEKPFLLLASSIAMVKQYVDRMHPRIETLLVYHKKPLSIIYPKSKNLPPYAISSDGSVGIRITNDPFSKTVIDLLGNPIISTSANLSGQPFPESFSDINQEVVDQVDYVCRHKREIVEKNSPSIIASYDKKGELIFLRT